MTSQTTHMGHVFSSRMSAAVLSWIVAIACLIGTQTAVGQVMYDNESTQYETNLKSAHDLATSAQLPVPRSVQPARPVCRDPAACPGCLSCVQKSIPQPKAAYSVQRLPKAKDCDCDNCVSKRQQAAAPKWDLAKPQRSLTNALSKLELTDAGVVENYTVPKGAYAPYTARKKTHQEFCDQMATLLHCNLKNLDPNDPAYKSTIEAAISMVVQNTSSEWKSQLGNVQKVYDQEIAHLRLELNKSFNEANTAKVLNGWLSSLYANQNRVFQNMQTLTNTTNSLRKSMANIERQLDGTRPTATVKTAPQQLTPIRQANSWEPDNSAEVKLLERQMREIQQRLQKLRTATPVRRATYLEPDYPQSNPLMPLPSRMSVPNSTYNNR